MNENSNEGRTDEQFWEDFAETVREAKELPEWKRKYRVMDGDRGESLVGWHDPSEHW